MFFCSREILDHLLIRTHMSSFGYNKVIMIVNLSRREDETYLLDSPSGSFLKGVAKSKKLEDGGFICSSSSLGSISYLHGCKVIIKHRFSQGW